MIGDKIRESGLSIQSLAEKMKVSEWEILKFERGLEKPDPLILIKLAKALNVNIEYLLQ